MKKLLFAICIVFIISSCGNTKQEKEAVQDTVTPLPIPKSDPLVEQDSIKAIGEQILISLKENDFAELRKYFSEEGVLFSPYGYIDIATSKKLTPDDFLTAVNKKWILTWGNYDGAGDPIKLTVTDYLKKFVYNAD